MQAFFGTAHLMQASVLSKVKSSHVYHKHIPNAYANQTVNETC